jgi:hypothetical protein
MWSNDNHYYGTWATNEAQKAVTRKTAEAYAFRPREIKRGVASKAVISTPQFDTNYFEVCDGEDPAMRYGLWERDYSMLLNVMRPALNNKRYTEIQYIDFREAIKTQVRGHLDWCSIPSSFPVMDKLGKCVLRYCHDFNAHYTTNLGAFTPNDFAEKCYQQVLFDRDGNQITNEQDYQRYMAVQRMQWSVLDGIINADPVASPTQYVSKGIRAWFRDFAIDHPELGVGCEWLAPATVTTSIALGDVASIIERRVKNINDRRQQVALQGVGVNGSNAITWDSWYLLMNDTDAECVIKAHVCQDICGGSPTITFNTPEQLRQFKQLYPPYLTGGRFGQGFITTPNGTEISIMRSDKLPRGEFYLLHNGTPTDPEGGLRLAMNNYTPYLSYMRERGYSLLAEAPTMFGGAVVVLQNTDVCGDLLYRWNWSLMSREPWTLTRYTNLDYDNCDEPTLASIEPLPVATGPENPSCAPIEEGD